MVPLMLFAPDFMTRHAVLRENISAASGMHSLMLASRYHGTYTYRAGSLFYRFIHFAQNDVGKP